MIVPKGIQRTTIVLFISFLLIFAGCFTGPAAFADTTDMGSAPPAGALTDISGHWGEKAINNAVSAGFVKGYPDGTFQPDKAVTRAEFVTMVNNALQLRDSNQVKLLFTDVDKTAWYHDEVAKASYVRYVAGTSETTFSPATNITRQEAAVMVSRFLPKAGMTGKDALASFPDQGKIASWAEEGLAIAINKGYMKGHSSGLIAPMGTLTRAEAAVIITNILNGETIVREDVFVQRSGDILKDNIYVGDITIAETVAEGDATLQNLSALSVVYVNGGGANTVNVDGSLIIRLVVTKAGTQVRVMAGDGTTIYTSVVFNNNLLVDSAGSEAEPDSESFEDIVIVQGLVTEDQARRIADAISQRITSSGSVTTQMVTDSVLSILTNSTTTTGQNGTIIVQVPATPPSPPAGSGSGSRTQPVTAVAFDGDTDYIGSALTAVVTPTEATVTYQWQRAATADGTFENIEGATSAEYSIAMEDIGQYLKVTATGTGSYSGTRSSAAALIGFAGGTGDIDTPYQIANWYHLDNMRYLLEKAYLLTADLGGTEPMYDSLAGTLNGDSEEPVFESEGYEDVVLENGWEPVGQYFSYTTADTGRDFTISGADPETPFFIGTFDGNDKIIKDLIVDKTYEVASVSSTYPSGNEAGLFGVTYQAEIKDLHLMDPQIAGTEYVGALAGYIRETEVSNVHVGVTLVPKGVESSYWRPSIRGEYRVGGLVGRNDSGSIENCSNEVEVMGIEYVGGIAGSNFIESPYVSVMVSASVPMPPSYEAIITGSSNSGYIYGYAFVGGIAGGSGTTDYDGSYGYDDTATYILECYNTGDVIYEDYSLPEASSAYVPMKFGGIAGGSSGVISECYNTGTVGTWWYPAEIDWDYIWAVGGIAGSTSGTIENSYNIGYINGYEYVAGIVGYIRDGEIVHNYNAGEINSYYYYDALSLGEISGTYSNEIYGYLDYDESVSVIEGNYFKASMYSTASEEESVVISKREEGVYRASLEEMRNPLTYDYSEEVGYRQLDSTCWDFGEIWAMNLYDNEGLPFLRWQWDEEGFKPITLEVTMPTASTITYGEPLNESILSGGLVTINGEAVGGEFRFYDGNYGAGPEYETVMVLFVPDSEDLYTFAGQIDVTVEKATPTVSTAPGASSITYGRSLEASEITGGEMIWISMSVPGTFAFTYDSEVPDAGTYQADVTFTPEADYLFNSVELTVDITVERALLTATVGDYSKTYGDGNPSFSVDVAGFVNWDTAASSAGYSAPTASGDADSESAVGTYTITISGGSADNYTFDTEDTGTLTVDARPITITADSDSLTYDGTAQTPSGSYISSGTLVSGHTYSATVSGSQQFVGSSGTTASDAAVLNASEADLTSNYDISYGSGTITVTQREITVTADSDSKTYDGSALTASGYSVTSGSLAAGDSISSITVTGSITDAGSSSNLVSGIAIGRGESDVTSNYSISTEEGTLTVYKADPTVTWPTVNRNLARGQDITSAIYSGGSGTPAGSFYYPTGSYGDVGIYNPTVIYMPNDTNNYNTASTGIAVEVVELTFDSIDVTYGSPDIRLNFSLPVNKTSTLYSAGDISIMIIKANGDEIEYQPKQIIQPNGSSSSFLIKLDASDAPEEGDTVIVEIRSSGAEKLVDAGGYSLTGTLVRSYYPVFEIVAVQSIARNESNLVDGIMVVFSLPVMDSSLDWLPYWIIEGWDMTGRSYYDFDTGETANDHIIYVNLTPGDVYLGQSFNVNTDGEYIMPADGSPGISNAWNAPVTNVWVD